MKICFKCLRVKPLSEFYRHPAMGDGYLGKCKDCAKADVKDNYKAKREQYVAYEKSRWAGRKSSDQERKQSAAYKEYKRKWREQNRDKVAAHNAVSQAVRDGLLVREKCRDCGDANSQGHHPDYSKPLSVIWLCKECHRREHSRLRGIAV